MFAETPAPPYTAVVFSSRRTQEEAEAYGAASQRMEELAARQPGYLGFETARDPGSWFGISVSYWTDDAAARAWKQVAEHVEIQRIGAERWYETYQVRIATVTRCYGPEAADSG